MFRFNPTIREANKYLSKTVDELSKKYGGVSNEEFESELIKTTGIGWKQVKNYKNNPKPSERIKDNAVVLKYIREQQASDGLRQIKMIMMYVTFFGGIGVLVYYFFNQPRKESLIIYQVPPNSIASREVESDFSLSVPSVQMTFAVGTSELRVEGLDCSVVGTGERTCTRNTPDSQIFIGINANTVTKYSLMLLNIEDAKAVESELNKYLKKHSINPIKTDGSLEKFRFETKSELIEYMNTIGKANMRPMISVSVTLKL